MELGILEGEERNIGGKQITCGKSWATENREAVCVILNLGDIKCIVLLFGKEIINFEPPKKPS